MAQPVLYTIPSFDAALGTNIPFAYDGDQVFGNELVIIDNETEAQVYDIKMSDWMRMYHTIGVDSGLVNGKYYACKIRVFNRDGVASDWSTWRSFYCFKTPVLSFTNIQTGQILDQSEYTFRLSYQQEQGEPLNTYSVMLYNANRVLLSKSSTLYGANELAYTIRQLEDSTQYYIRATGDTLNGMSVDTGYINFSVKYVVPAYWAYVDLSNNKDDGSIRISCNIRSITGTFEGDGEAEFFDNKMINLTDPGKKVIFNDGFVQVGDFTVKILGSNFKNGETIFEMTDDEGVTIELIYREGWFSADSQFAQGKAADNEMLGCWLPYFIVRASSSGMTYEILSDALDKIDNTIGPLDMTSISYNIIVPTTGWEDGEFKYGNTTYTRKCIVPAEQATENPTLVNMAYSGGDYNSYCRIGLVDTRNGEVILWANDDPTSECQITIQDMNSDTGLVGEMKEYLIILKRIGDLYSISTQVVAISDVKQE